MLYICYTLQTVGIIIIISLYWRQIFLAWKYNFFGSICFVQKPLCTTNFIIIGQPSEFLLLIDSFFCDLKGILCAQV